MDIPRYSITKSPAETTALGTKLANSLVTRARRDRGDTEPHVVCLYGELGSGKTTFVQGFAKGLGITSRLLSPTFIIVRRYEVPVSFTFLYHIDLYRVKTQKELTDLGLPEILSDSLSCTLIEWAERLGDILPKRRTDIHFSLEENTGHKVTIRHVRL